MPTFEYKIVNKSGDEENRHSFFLSKDELLQSLSSNEFLLSCKEISSRARALSRNNLLSFTSQMASMVSNGVKIDESLEYIAESQNQADIKVLAGELLERIRAGTPFSDSLHESSILIPQYYISAIRGGEESNNLDKALVFLYQYIKDADQGSKKMMSALMYPIFVFCIAVIACTYMLLEVVPEMQKNYSVIGQQLPEMTFLKEYGMLLVIFLFLLVIFVKLTFAGKYRVYYLLFIAKIPIIGKTLNLADNYNMLMTAGLLIKQGVAVDVSLNIAKAGLFFTQNKPKINDGIESIRSGQEMSNALFDANILDTTTVGIMRSGEISNIPGERMIDVAKIIKEKRDKMLEIITSLIGPISVVIVGIMILLIILGMLMPMFNLNDMEF